MIRSKFDTIMGMEHGPFGNKVIEVLQIVKQQGYANSHDLMQLFNEGCDVREFLRQAKHRKIHAAELVAFFEDGTPCPSLN